MTRVSKKPLTTKSIRICECEFEMRVNYTKLVNYNSLNAFTETIGFTFIRKYLTSISKLLDFVGFLNS